MKINSVLLVLLTFALAFGLSCKDENESPSAQNVKNAEPKKNEDFIEPPPIKRPAIIDEKEIDPNEINPIEDPEIEACEDTQIDSSKSPDVNPSKVEGPYPESGYNSSLGLGGNLGGGGGPSGSGDRAFRYRRERPKPSQNPTGNYHPYEKSNSSSEEYSDYSINKFVSTTDSVFSTFAIDVDTASYSVMRNKINEDQLPPTSSVRVEEYINYFNYNYPAPTSGLFAVHAKIADNPFNNGETKLMRVALRAKDINKNDRKTAHLTFLIDTSGSMDDSNKLPLVVKTLKLLTENLRADDTIAICTYASRATKVLEPTPIADKEKILAVLDSLQASGSTHGEEGLKLAYKIAASSFNQRHINRIILCTDGDFNVGEIDGKTLAEAVNYYSQKGITITTVGYGEGNYKDKTLESIANASNGNYFFVDTIDEVKKVFGTDLISTLDVVAADVKIQLEFNPNFVRQYRLVGYETRKLKTEDFRNDIVDAGEIGPGHKVTAIYELVMESPLANKLKVPEDLEDFAAIFRIRYKEFITDMNAVEANFGIEKQVNVFESTDNSFKLAVGVMGFADILRDSPYTKGWKINTAIDCCDAMGDDAKVKEFIDLMRKAIALRDK